MNKKTPTILVVEDEKSLRDVITFKLRASGFEVAHFSRVKEALHYLENNIVSAIWLDHYLMGKESGLDLVEKLHEKGGHYKKIPIYVVSNTASAEKRQAYIKLGVKRYYVKSNHSLGDITSDIQQGVL